MTTASPAPPVYAPERECKNDDPHATLELNVNDGAGDLAADCWRCRARPMRPAASSPGGWSSAWGTIPTTGRRWRKAISRWTTRCCSIGISPTCPTRPITLHLYMKGTDGYAERFVHFTLALPTPTPLPTFTPSPTVTPSPTLTPSPRTLRSPTNTPVPTDTPILRRRRRTLRHPNDFRFQIYDLRLGKCEQSAGFGYGSIAP